MFAPIKAALRAGIIQLYVRFVLPEEYSFKHELAPAFDPSGDTDCDEATLLGAASMVRELRERAERAEALSDTTQVRKDLAAYEKLQAERDDLAGMVNQLRETWAATAKANGELGTAHVAALCEIDELRSIIWHFALRANLAVADAMKQLNEPQQQKVREIWRASPANAPARAAGTCAKPHLASARRMTFNA